MSSSGNGSTLAIGATLALAAAGVLARTSGSRSSTKDRGEALLRSSKARIDERLRAIEALPPGLGDERKATRDFFSALYNDGEPLPEEDFASLPTLTSDRAAAETGARRLRAELADPQGLGRNFGQLSESERFHRDFLMRDLGQLEEAFGPSIGKAPMRSAARRAYRASYEADEDDEG